MKKRFNITGLCINSKHYMVDISDKTDKIISMIKYGDYFTINRPRQFGKTTTLNILCNMLHKDYVVIKTSFEGVGSDMFNSESLFCGTILKIFSTSIMSREPEYAELLLSYGNIRSFTELSFTFSDFIRKCDRPVILMIDEVDKSSNSKIFIQFLGLLRNKYLTSAEGCDTSFQSVILAGVHDIRTLKLAIRDENDVRFNSPWNISAEFDIDMSFNPKEIEGMLLEYQSDKGVSMDITKLSALIHMFTSGYPYLVSGICKIIDESLNAVWTENSVYWAVSCMLDKKNTLFEDVIKNIENNQDTKAVVNQILIQGRIVNYNPYAYEKGLIYGIFRKKGKRLVIHNMIFEELIYNYMVEQEHIMKMQVPVLIAEQDKYTADGELQLENVLLRFQEFMYQEYRKEDESFYEAQGRLIFLAYLKPILNGRGFYFVEPETRENKRLDVVIVFGGNKYVVELKLWNGKSYEEKGISQLSEYLDIQGLPEGYLLIFNFNINKHTAAEWIEINGKRIFEVIV